MGRHGATRMRSRWAPLTMKPRYFVAIGLLYLLPSAAGAQGADQGYSSALTHLATRMGADPTLPASLRDFSPAELIAREAMNALPLLPYSPRTSSRCGEGPTQVSMKRFQ